MAKLLKLRRGSTSDHGSFTGAEGEVTVDTTKDTLVVHDGSTAGGHEMLREDMSNLPAGTIDNADINASAAIAGTKISPDFGSQNIATTGNASIGGTNLNMSSAYIDFSGSLGSAPTTAAAIYRPADNSLAISTGNNQRFLVNNAGASVIGNITVSGTVDGKDISALGITGTTLDNGVTATTQSASDNSTKVATTAYTDTAISNLVDSSPSTLNTLNELAAALGDDANFSTTVTNSIATKLPLAGGTMSGNLIIGGSNVVFGDSSSAGTNLNRLKFGAGDDFHIYHDSAGNNFVRSTNDHDIILRGGTGDAYVQGSDCFLGNSGGTKKYLDAHEDGAVEIYHSNNKKLETTSAGVTVTGALTATGDVTAFSDKTLKTDINTINDALSTVGKLRGVSYKWKENNKPSIGVIAQEVEQVIPEVVHTNEHDGKEVKSVDYGKIVGVLIEAIKELKAEVEELKGAK